MVALTRLEPILRRESPPATQGRLNALCRRLLPRRHNRLPPLILHPLPQPQSRRTGYAPPSIDPPVRPHSIIRDCRPQPCLWIQGARPRDLDEVCSLPCAEWCGSEERDEHPPLPSLRREGVSPPPFLSDYTDRSLQVLNTLSKSWILIGTPLQSSLIALLSPIPFLPTSQGPKKPSESYFANDHLFDDLPTIVLPSGMTVKGSMEKMLASFGVRKHVEVSSQSPIRAEVD